MQYAECDKFHYVDHVIARIYAHKLNRSIEIHLFRCGSLSFSFVIAFSFSLRRIRLKCTSIENSILLSIRGEYMRFSQSTPHMLCDSNEITSHHHHERSQHFFFALLFSIDR